MSVLRTLKDDNGNKVYPISHAKAIYVGDTGSSTLDATLNTLATTAVASTSANGLLSSSSVAYLPTNSLGTLAYSTTDVKVSSASLANDSQKLGGTTASDYTTTAYVASNYVSTAKIGVVSGVAPLGADGKISSSYLPGYVDDVLEYGSTSAFPSTGESGKIYIATDTNITYRWSGTQYTAIGSDLALGETEKTAYRGDRGAAAYAHAVTNKGTSVASGFNKLTANAEGHITAATAVTQSDITGLGIPTTAVATSSANGLFSSSYVSKLGYLPTAALGTLAYSSATIPSTSGLITSSATVANANKLGGTTASAYATTATLAAYATTAALAGKASTAVATTAANGLLSSSRVAYLPTKALGTLAYSSATIPSTAGLVTTAKLSTAASVSGTVLTLNFA